MVPFKCKCSSVSCLYLQNCLFYLGLSFGQLLGDNCPFGFLLCWSILSVVYMRMSISELVFEAGCGIDCIGS